MSLHAARLEKSDRLQRVRNVLLDGMRHTTRDLIRKARVCAVNSIIAELRENGMQIECQRVRNLWYYQVKC